MTNFLSIRTILVLAFVLAAGLPLALFWIWPQTSLLTAQMDEVRNRQAQLARNLATSMEAYHDDVVTALRAFSPLIADGRGEEVRTSLEKLHFTRICVVNPDTGAVTRAFLGEERGCPDWYSEERRTMFVDLAGPAGVGVSPVAFSVNGPAEIHLATRAYDVLVVAAISTQFFRDLRRGADADGDGYTAIIDQTGHVLAHPKAAWQDVATDLTGLEPVQNILAGNSGAGNFRLDLNGAELVAGFAHVDGPGWGVFIPRSIAALKQAATKIQNEAILVLAIALCLSGIAGILIARFISRQVSSIQRTTRLMADGDATARVAESGPQAPRLRELRDLGTSLNTMADDIKVAHQGELRARQIAEHAAAEKAEFLANLGGEIRTPVTSIMNLTDLMRKDPLMGARARQLDAVSDTGRTLLTLLDDVLDFSLMETGKMRLKSEPVDLTNLTLSVVRLMMPVAARNGIQIITRVPPEASMLVLGDAGRLRQILLNLIGNAVKFTPEGHIFVGLQVVPVDPIAASVQISVTDTGVGMSPERMDTIFSAFEYPEEDPAEARGAGLGLAICQRITAAMDGALTVESARGAGSTFQFTAQMLLAAPEEIIEPNTGAFSDMRVMVLVANATQRETLESYLGDLGLSDMVNTERQATIRILSGQTAPSGGIDAIIYDPTGIDFSLADIQRLAARYAGSKRLRVIILADSSTLSEDVPEHAILVDKPIAPADICAALLQVGSKRNARSSGELSGDVKPSVHGFLQSRSSPSDLPGTAEAVQLFSTASIHRGSSPRLEHVSSGAKGSMPASIAEILDASPQGPDAGHQFTHDRVAILIDDSDVASSEIAVILDQFDLKTEIVPDGASAEHVLMTANTVAAVLIDLEALGGKALDIARTLGRRRRELGHDRCMIIGLATSGRGTPERNLRSAGFTHLLKKPVKASVLQRLFGASERPKALASAANSA